MENHGFASQYTSFTLNYTFSTAGEFRTKGTQEMVCKLLEIIGNDINCKTPEDLLPYLILA